MYLTYATDRNFAKALEQAEKCIDLAGETYGPKSRKMASKYSQKATCLLHLGKKEQAVDTIKNTIDIFENPVEKEVPEAEKEGLEAKPDPTSPS